MLRILISSSTFPLSPDDGLPRFVLDLGQELARRSTVAVLVPGAPGAPTREMWGPLEIHRFTYFVPRSWQKLAYGHGMRQNMGSLLARIQVVPYLLSLGVTTRAVVRKWRPDVVNSHWLVPHGLATAFALPRSRRAAHVLSVHAGDVYVLEHSPFGRSIARFVVSRTDAVLAAGSHVRDTLDRLIGRSSEAVLQPMGLSLDRFATNAGAEHEIPDAEYIVFVGRLVEKKGVVHLLRALPRILERRPSLRLLVIGDGPLREDLVIETQRLGIDGSVSFLGRKDQDAVAGYLRHCRAAVVPSVVDRNGETDGMPTVVLEAMAAGARVIGTAVDGIPDVLQDHRNGWLCRPGSGDALASAILDALDEPNVEAMLRNARATAEAHSWSNVAARYATVFSQVATSSGRLTALA